MNYKRCVVFLIALYFIATATIQSQILSGDPNFKGVLEKVRWDMNLRQIHGVCDSEGLTGRETDSSLVINSRIFNRDAMLDFRTSNDKGTLSMIQVSFPGTKEGLDDTLISHFTRTLGRNPERRTQEKNLVVFTMKMEMLFWRAVKEMVNVLVIRRGEFLMDVKLTLHPVRGETRGATQVRGKG